VEGDRYLTAAVTAQRDAVEEIIADAQGDMLRRAHPPAVLTGTQTVSLARDFPQPAAQLGLDDAALAELADATPPVADRVLRPMLAAALHVTEVIGPFAADLAKQVRAGAVPPPAGNRPGRADPVALITRILGEHDAAGSPLPLLAGTRVRGRLNAGWDPADPLLTVSLGQIATRAGFSAFDRAWLAVLRPALEDTLARDDQPAQDDSDGAGPLLFGRFSFDSRYRTFRTWVNGPAGRRRGCPRGFPIRSVNWPPGTNGNGTTSAGGCPASGRVTLVVSPRCRSGAAHVQNVIPNAGVLWETAAV
jgi:hypothetical protein